MQTNSQNKNYLIVLSSKLNREEVIEYLSSIEAIKTWFYDLPNSFFIQSDLSAEELSNHIKEQFGKERHFITEVHNNRQGLLTKSHWAKFYKNDG
jgi:hypothetical protein